jgi:predicted N-formylglutamate amidohydrolase
MLPLQISSEPASHEIINQFGHSDIVLVCDHASNRIPMHLKSLGLTEEELNSHIGWDPGAHLVASYLSAHLDAPLVFSNYSRLVIDCNRPPERIDSIPTISDNIKIHGNQGLTKQECLNRRKFLFNPYHNAIDELLQSRVGRNTFLLSIHSFTPVLQGITRPWQIGVCYLEESKWSRNWLSALQGQLDVKVGYNQPYSIETGWDYTIPIHGKKHGVPAIMLEIRQDEISNQSKADAWGKTIEKAWQTCFEIRNSTLFN